MDKVELKSRFYHLKTDPFSSHTLIASLVHKQASLTSDDQHVVLDIGCATGFLRHYLQSPRFYLIGVDIDSKAVELARTTYDEAYQVDIAAGEQFEPSLSPQTIVMGDILEHLSDPAGVLSHVLRSYARPGTQIIISVPNVAHLYVRLNLLLGRFEYADRGIMDRTHLRFFTLRSARELIESCDLTVVSMKTTPVPLPLISPLFGEGGILYPVHAMSFLMARTLKTLLAYQFILESLYNA